MINRLSSWSIRTHMVILLCLLALPCMVLIVRSGMSERRQAIEEAKRERLRFVATVASEQQSLVAGAEQLARALALVPDVRTRDAEAARTLFSELLKANPQFSNISVADKTGVVWASAVPIRGTVNVADRRSFREAVRTGKFSSGEYSIGRLLKKPVINFGYPVKDKKGELLAVISIVFDLNQVEKMFEKLGPAPGTTFSMLDHQGTIIIRRPKDGFSSRLDGQRDISEMVFPTMNEGPDEGAFETMGNDGEPRFFVYRKIRLPQESKPYLYIRSSVPLASVISRANAAMLQNLAMLFVICGVGVALVWSIGKRVIVNPVLGLTKASEQLSAGAGAVKVSGAVTGGELGQLARAFDNMAEALTDRERALRESEERYRLLVETANEGIWSMDGDQVTTYVNQAMAAMLGCTPSEAIGKKIEDFSFPEDMAFLAARMSVRHSGGDEVYERRIRRADGSALWALVSAKALCGGEDKFAGSFAMFTDITGIKRSEEALRLSEERFRLSQAAASAGTWEWDLRTNENFWSDELWRLYGLEPHSCEASYESWLKTIHPDDREKSIAAVQKAAGGGEELNAEWRAVYPDGTVRWLMSRGGPLRDAAGRVIRFVGIVIDITARRVAEEALRTSEQRFRDVSEAAGEFIFEVDAEGHLTFISDRVQDVLEYAPKEIAGKMFFDLLPEADTSRIKSLFGEHIRARSAVRDLEHQALTRSGGTIWLNIATVPIFDDKGNFLGFRGAAMNVTARKEAEKNIRSSLKEKEVLLKEIHHRVKNNLQVISSLLRMQSQYVHDPGDADSFRASIDRIKSMALIHDKLYRSGTLASIALPDYVNDLVSGLHSTYSLETPVEMEIHVGPPFLGIDDAVPVGLILNELISNSLKHAFPGQDSGMISIHIEENGENRITLIISDNGVGIPADLDFTNTPSLGMQLVVTLVEQLDGTIELNRDRGTKFTITFTAGG